jgi:hypothetical protein
LIDCEAKAGCFFDVIELLLERVFDALEYTNELLQAHRDDE